MTDQPIHLDQATLDEVAKRLRDKIRQDRLLRDDHRKHDNWILASMYGDRVCAFTEIETMISTMSKELD